MLDDLDILPYLQQHDHTCAQACVRILYALYELPVPSEEHLADEMRATEKRGTPPSRIVRWLKTHGWDAHYEMPSTLAALHEALNAGIMPIIAWVEWRGHYIVIQGRWPGGFWIYDPAEELGRERAVTTEKLVDQWTTWHTRREKLAIYATPLKTER